MYNSKTFIEILTKIRKENKEERIERDLEDDKREEEPILLIDNHVLAGRLCIKHRSLSEDS